MPVGKIYQSLGGFYDICNGDRMYRTRARGNFRVRGIKPVVGDLVSFKKGYLLGVKPRRNRLQRPPLANVDQAIIVTSVQMPVFSTGLLDRQLIALQKQLITPIIYFSKLDLLNSAERVKYLSIAKRYHQIGYSVIAPCQPFMDSTLNEIKDNLKNHETVVMGQTGAGKSTLLNHLKPSLHLKTGRVSRALHRGKHTTRRVHLISMHGGTIADTPGFSAYRVSGIDIYHLKNYFPEFVRYAGRCRFRECLHVHEPQCEIKRLVRSGKIMKSRYHTYLHLFKLIKAQKPVYHHKN